MRLGQHRVGRRGVAEQTQLERVLRAEHPAGEQEVKSAVAPDEAVQMIEMDGGQQADFKLRIAKGRVLRGHQQVAGDGHRHAAAAHRPGDGAYHGLGQAGLHIKELKVQLVDHRMLVGR